MSVQMGIFKKVSTGFEGSLKSIGLNLPDVKLTKIEGPKRADKSPDFDVWAEGVKCGAGWAKPYKDSQSGEKKSFVSAVMDDPSFPHKVNFSLFADKTGTNYQAIWNRPETRQ